MKKYFYLFFILPAVAFGQLKKENYDYFVQFNTPKFAQKVNIDSLLNHKAVKMITGEESKSRLSDFASFIDKSKVVTIHGNFTDTIPYYQLSMPLLDAKGLQGFIQKKADKSNETKSDSIVDAIKIYPKYSVYSSKDEEFSIAWDDKNLVVYQLLDAPRSYKYGDLVPPADYDSAAVAVDSVAVPVIEEIRETVTEAPEYVLEAPIEVAVDAPAETVVDSAAAVIDEEYNEEYYKKLDEEYAREKRVKRLEKQAKQEAQIALMFNNGFVAPASNKVSQDSDIAAWVNYRSGLDYMYNFRYLFARPSALQYFEPENVVKGMNFDFYFENDKARLEQSVEYSESMAKIVRKVVSRKPNKNIFKFFPSEEPLAYMSYHVDTEEALKNYPKLTEQFLVNMPLEKQDIDIMTDLFSTIIDEEAVATLMDGDISIFLHGIKTYDEKIKTVSYNDEYEPIDEEKTVKRTKPVFSFVITSTHPTMADKLLNLGLRKNILQKQNDYYLVKKSEEIGGLIIKKEGNVIVFTNGLNYVKNNEPSNFSKKVKKDLSKNYMYGNFDLRNFIKSYFLNQDLGADTAKYIQLSNRFKNIEVKASNKMEKNRMKVEIEFNSSLSDKNIILQSLDLIHLMK